MREKLFTLIGILSVAMVTLFTTPSCIAQDKTNRVFEMRTYICHEDKLEDLHARFRNNTNRLFVKHGMQLVGYWVPQEKKDTLVYILAYPSREAREKSWESFKIDPEWKKIFAESRRDGPIVMKVINQVMDPTDYSLIK